jgi:hypothetical protein
MDSVYWNLRRRHLRVTESIARIELWEELVRILPRDFHSLLQGDFNFVENRSDKSNICDKLILDNEKAVFILLTFLLGVEDRVPSNGPLRLSWDNRWKDKVKVMARLDRFYSFQATAPRLETIEEYIIKRDSSTQSNHLAVWCSLVLLP